MYPSIDNGSTWYTTPKTENYGDTSGLYLANYNIFALWGNSEVMFAGTAQGVYVADYAGSGGGWMPANTGIAHLQVNAITKVDTTMFVGTSSGLYSSTNNGGVWLSADPLSGPILSLATDGTFLFAGEGAQDGVIYTNDGQHWKTANDGLTDTAKQAGGIALAIAGNYVYLATVNGGLWQRPLSEFSAVRTAFVNQPELSPNYPNPFHTSTSIHYSLAQADRVSLSVYNMLGERVAILKDDVEQAGDNEATFESGALPSGLYCYRLSTANGGTSTRIMQVER